MRAAVMLAALALAACQVGTASPNRSSPGPTLSAQPSIPPSAASPARTTPQIAIPIPTVTITPAGASLACRLPVVWEFGDSNNSAYYVTAFLTFPTGDLTEIRAARTTAVFYDRAYSKWLPVPRQNVSPDGRRYAYTDGNPMVGDTKGKVHMVDVATGADRVLYSGAPIFQVVDFTAEGIYLSAESVQGVTRGLWLENPAGGTPRLISISIVGPVIAGRAAWGLAFNSADPHPAPDRPSNELTRLDLVTGASTTLFYRPGANIEPLGVDQSGVLVVGVFGSAGSEEVWQIASATVMYKLATFTASTGPGGIVAVDRHGVWYVGFGHQPQIVWLFGGGAFRTVARVDFAYSLSVAGGCIP